MSTETTARLRDMTQDVKTRRYVLTLEMQDAPAAMRIWDELHGDEKVSVRFSKYRRKRSLDANAYAWTLLDKLSACLRIPKETLYRGYIKDVGGVSDTVCVKTESVPKLCATWEKNGIGWQWASFPSSTNGYTNVILYYGSSTYDTAQMARLIDLIVQDCKAQHIETADPEDVKSLLQMWDEKTKRK